MDAFEVAYDLLGDLPLTTGQITQLRAIDHKYWQAVFTLLDAEAGDARGRGAEPSLSPEQVADLRAMLVREVRDLVTPEQRATLGWA